MALEFRLSGVAYSVQSSLSIRQQGGAVSVVNVTVRNDGQGVPRAHMLGQFYMDGVLFFSGIVQRVTHPRYDTGYEAEEYALEIQSLEVILNNRLITRNWYNKLVHEIVADILTEYLADDGITLGEISTTTVSLRSYKKTREKAADVFRDLASRVDGCSFFISPDKKLYFLVRADFDTVTVPADITNLQKVEAIGDMRNVQTVVGATSRIVATEENVMGIAALMALNGTSGRLEATDSDSSIHNLAAAEAKAEALLDERAEREETITLTCHDLAATQPFKEWPIVRPAQGISGYYVVTERTITVSGSVYDIAVVLKNRNYFARYGYSLRAAQLAAEEAGGEITDIYSDDKLSPVEKLEALRKWRVALQEKAALDAQADAYGVARTEYDAAFLALATYLNNGAAWTAGDPAWLSTDELTITTDISNDEYMTAWNDLAAAREALIAAITASVSAEAKEAGASLKLSASLALRSRANAVAPASLLCSAAYADGSPYAGYFLIEASADGEDYEALYSSSGPESSHSESIPATIGIEGTQYFVVAIRVRLFQDAAMEKMRGEGFVAVMADSSTLPTYHGARTSAPSSGFAVNDFYFDSNLPNAGGGNLRYWTGSAWIVASASWTWYASSVKLALADMCAWCTTNAESITDVVAFETAIINSLTVRNAIIDYLATSKQVSTALCSDGATRRSEIDWDNARAIFRGDDKNNYIEIFKNYLRTNYKALATDLTENGLIWRDASLNEAARLYYADKFLRFTCGGDSVRLPRSEYPVGYKVGLNLSVSSGGVPQLAAGGCEHVNKGATVGIRKANGYSITSGMTNYPSIGSWAYVAVRVGGGLNIASASTPISGSYPGKKCLLIARDGTIRLFFQDASGNIYQSTSTDWATWTTPVLVRAPEELCTLSLDSVIETSDGQFRLFYTDGYDYSNPFNTLISSNGTTWSSGGQFWSTSTPPHASAVQLRDGSFVMAYRTAIGGLAILRSVDGVNWTEFSTITTDSYDNPEIIQTRYGVFRVFAYAYTGGGLKQFTSTDLSTWSAAATVVSSVYNNKPAVIQNSDGSISVIYIAPSTRDVMSISSVDGTTWQTAKQIAAGTAATPCAVIDREMTPHLVYSTTAGTITFVNAETNEVALFPATGALTGRPTDAVNIATTTGANFATLYNGGYYYRDSSGVYWRILGAIGRRASAGAATDFYTINLGNGSEESGKNDRGYWTRDGRGTQRNSSYEISLPGAALGTDMAGQSFYSPAACGSIPFNAQVTTCRGNDTGNASELGLFWMNGPYFGMATDVAVLALYTYRHSMTANYTRVFITSEQNYTS